MLAYGSDYASEFFHAILAKKQIYSSCCLLLKILRCFIFYFFFSTFYFSLLLRNVWLWNDVVYCSEDIPFRVNSQMLHKFSYGFVTMAWDGKITQSWSNDVKSSHAIRLSQCVVPFGEYVGVMIETNLVVFFYTPIQSNVQTRFGWKKRNKSTKSNVNKRW